MWHNCIVLSVRDKFTFNKSQMSDICVYEKNITVKFDQNSLVLVRACVQLQQLQPTLPFHSLLLLLSPRHSFRQLSNFPPHHSFIHSNKTQRIFFFLIKKTTLFSSISRTLISPPNQFNSIKTKQIMDIESNGSNKRVFHRLGNPKPNNQFHHQQPQQQKVCYHWQAGRCTRNPCAFLHRELPPPPIHNPNSSASTSYNGGSKRAHGLGGGGGPQSDGFSSRKNPNFNNSWGRAGAGPPKKLERVCNYWVQGNCTYGDHCKFLHSWSIGGSFSLLTTLEAHQKVVTGITLPSGDKLYTGAKDEHVKIWDCASGQCVRAVPLGAEIGCMISEGPWVFIGLPNMVKAWNIETATDMSLSGPVGQVYALVVGNDLLFAGTQDGTILAWKFNPATNCFEPAASLTGHTRAVVTMFVGANRLYSGSMDNSIRVWNLETLQCIQTLTEHTSVVMSVLCWEQFLLSASLDNTIKVWAASQSGNLEVTYTHTEEHGILTLCGMFDSEGKPVLLCSTNDNFVHIYDLPSFMERGKIISKQEIRAIQAGPSGLFFTGDGNGQVRVWNWLTEPKTAM